MSPPGIALSPAELSVQGIYLWVNLDNESEPEQLPSTRLSYPVPLSQHELGLFRYGLASDSPDHVRPLSAFAYNWNTGRRDDISDRFAEFSARPGVSLGELRQSRPEVHKELLATYLYLVDHYREAASQPVARRYLQLLLDVDEPLLEYYYCLNPDYFSWITE